MEVKHNRQFWGVIWSLFDRLGAQFVTFIIGIVLARLLTPADYGLVGIIAIFIAVSNVLIEGGFSNALIRKLDRTESDLSTAFYFNVVVGIFLYVLLFFLAPFIATYFEDPLLIPLLRIIGLNVFFNSLCIVQNAILTAELNIKLQTLISLCSQIPMGIIAIYLAYKGFGVYALAIQSVGYTFIKTILFWCFARWRPITGFSKDSFNYLLSFGSKLVGANLIGTVFNEIYSIVIGKCIGKQELGYYTKARSLASQPDMICAGVIQKVTLPVLANVQDDKYTLLLVYRKYIKMIMCLMAPLASFLILAAKPIVIFLWTDKWSESIFLFQMLVFAGLWSPVSYLNLCLLQVLNRTGYILKLEFIKKPISLIIILISVQGGIIGIVVGQILIAVIADTINMSISKQLLAYTYRLQFSDILRYMFFAFVAGLIGYFITILFSNLALIILFSFVAVSVVYTLLLYLFRDPVVQEIRTVLKNM